MAVVTPGETEHRRPVRGKPVPKLATELLDLVKGYARQEIVDPLKPLGRFVGLGLAGSMALGVGFVFLIVAGLRVLQVETAPHLRGHWNWVPHLVVLVVAAALAFVYLRTITRRKDA